MSHSLISTRVKCPCCGYPTLTERARYDICELCNWEDDGQDDENATEVWGGPNSDYSLAEARENFKRYRVMYAPGRDQRITPGNSEIEYKTKGELMEAFNALASANIPAVKSLEKEIVRLEKVLTEETKRKVKEYEQQIGKA